MTRKDACWIIKNELCSGPKTSRQLREACRRGGFADSTFYYHLKQLIAKLGEVEEVSERDSKGRLIKKYALVKKQRAASSGRIVWSYNSKGEECFGVGDLQIEYPPSRVLLELAAWIRYDPADWDTDAVSVRRAKLCLEHCSSLVPEVGKTREDPDKYAFIWSDEALEKLKLDDAVSSRFFDYISVCDVVENDLSKRSQNEKLVFLGAYSSLVIVGYDGYCVGMQSIRHVGQPNVFYPVKEPLSISVAVSKENDALRVLHVETREGKLDKSWVSGIAKHLKAEKTRALNSDFLKEDDRRDLLLNLREVLGRRKLRIPRRYEALIHELQEYSYKKPSRGYVIALALAVSLSSENQH